MKKLFAILSLGLIFSCQEAIEPEIIVEEVESVSSSLEIEGLEEEIEIILEGTFGIEETARQEAIKQKVLNEVEILLNLAANQAHNIDIIEVPETEVEILETPRKN